jgi:AcrR family transcriptional regulator
MAERDAASRGAAGSGPTGARAETEELIVAAAQRLFVERGFQAVTVRDIGAEAGVSHALVHRYLGSKEQILAAVLRRNQMPVLEKALEADTAGGAALAMFEELRSARSDYLILLARVVLDRVPFEASGHSFLAYRRLIELLELQAAGGGAKAQSFPEPRVIAAALTALVIGWTVTEPWLLPASGLAAASREDIDASLRRLVVTMVDGSLPPAGGGGPGR